jgi:amino acid adenylation domain-containing protein/non-ribosomal peptide synthase protein (TIGR01720 family)
MQSLDALSPQRRALLALRLARRGLPSASSSPISRTVRDGSSLPLSFGQQRLFVLDQIDPANAAYNVPTAFCLRGDLDVSVLERALTEILRRHEVLRGTIELAGGRPVTRGAAPGPFALEIRSVEHLPQSERDGAAQALCDAEAGRPFDLARGPLARGLLVRLGGPDFRLVITLHHIVADGWSQGVLVRELSALYGAFLAGRASPLAEPVLQYADFAAWQRAELADDRIESGLEYWTKRLSGAPALEFPTDHPRPAELTYRGAHLAFRWPCDIRDSLQELARGRGATLYMALLAAFNVLLHRYSGQDDVVLGSVIANRHRVELEPLIGFFVNTLVFRNDISGDPTFVELLARTRDVALAAHSHQDLPFERLVDALRPPRDRSRHPLFQIVFVLQNWLLPELLLPRVTATPIDVETGRSQFDLSVSLRDTTDGLVGSVEYATDLFERSTIGRLVDNFETLLRAAIADPHRRVSELPIVSAREASQIAVWGAARKADLPGLPLHHRFETYARSQPQAVAVRFEDRSLSYGELNGRANRLAHRLRDLGVGPDVLVGLCVERSMDLVVGILGILKAGGAYVPLDPGYPADRLAFMVEDARVPVVVTHAPAMAALPRLADAARVMIEDLAAEPREHDAPPLASSDHVAYVIYTSGSTGKPKGVLVSHANMSRLMDATNDWFGFGPRDVWTLFHSFAFDFSVWELWGALAFGGRLVVVPYWVSRSPEAFVELLRTERVTVLNQTPSAFRPLIQAEAASGSPDDLHLRLVIFGGEALDLGSLRPWFARHGDARPQLVNMYGITETTVHVTYRPIRQRDVDAGLGSVIGVPIPDLSVRVLDRHRQMVPIGVPGELYVAGAGVSGGYLRRPELTAERFISDPGGSERGRLYRSGDLVRYLPNGDLEYQGRIDDQVKIRGFRIELGEIESVLSEHPAVREVSVIAREDSAGDRRLVAYIVADEQHDLFEELRAAAQARLPVYMVPAAFVRLSRLPLTHNGKVDRRALPKPDVDPRLSERYLAPRTSAEATLADIWRDVLGLPLVGVHDNFFDLGGDSILSIQVLARARRAGLSLTPKQLFKMPTIAQLAAAAAATEGPSPEPRPSAAGAIPLTPIQHWFFEQQLSDPSHWNQAFAFEVAAGTDAGRLERAVARVIEHHESFRLRFTRGAGGWTQRYGECTAPPLRRVDLAHVTAAERSAQIAALGSALQEGFDLEHGPLLAAVHADFGAHESGRLLLAIHHLAVDAVSWRILLEDLETAYAGHALPPQTSPFGEWAKRLVERAATPELAAELDYWTARGDARTALLPEDGPGGDDVEAEVDTVRTKLGPEETRALLQRAPAAYRAQAHDLLLAAVTFALTDPRSDTPIVIDVEGHGREPLDDVDVSRTVGWFTTISPLVVRLPAEGDLGSNLKAVKEQIRRVPDKGRGYGLLRYLTTDPTAPAALRSLPEADVVFNYLGQIDRAVSGTSVFRFANESCGPWHAPRARRPYKVEILCLVRSGCLEMNWLYARTRYLRATIEAAAARFEQVLRDTLQHCLGKESRASTPSDFPLARIEQSAIDRLEKDHGEIEDVYPLSAMQRLFHSMDASGNGLGFEQWRFEIRGALDPVRLRAAWQRVIERHTILRTMFVASRAGEPLQAVVRRAELPWAEHDLRSTPPDALAARLEALLDLDRRAGFALDHPPLLRVTLVRLADEVWQLVWSTHHLLVDGWSWPLVFRDLAAGYSGETSVLANKACPYGRYIEWLTVRRSSGGEQYWSRLLLGYTEPTPIPGQAPRGVGSEGWLGEVEDRLQAATLRALRENARMRGVTLSTLTQAAWALVLAHRADRRDIVFGVATSGRPSEVPDIETMVGPCVTNIPVRARIEPELPVFEWLAALQEQQLDSAPHQYVSTEDLQRWSELSPRHRLFDSLLVFQNYVVDPAVKRFGSELAIEVLSAPEATNYPITVMAFPGEDLRLRILYHRTRIAPEDARTTLAELRGLLATISERPDITVAAWQSVLAAATRGTARAAVAPISSGAPPRSDLERRLASLWQELFEVDHVAIDANFFDLGGHSLLLLKLHARLAALVGRELPIVTLFQFPTIGLLARHLSEGTGNGRAQRDFAERARRQREALTRTLRVPSRR